MMFFHDQRVGFFVPFRRTVASCLLYADTNRGNCQLLKRQFKSEMRAVGRRADRRGERAVISSLGCRTELERDNSAERFLAVEEFTKNSDSAHPS